MKKSIVQWCKDLHEAGNELTMKWDGGGDSGWVYFEIDGETADNEYTRALVDKMYDTLNYGSWAGEFTASGEATYDPETNSFKGTDYYGEDDHDIINTEICIRIPKHLWFNTLHVECECYYDDTCDISVRFIVRNGFLSEEHAKLSDNLQEEISKELQRAFDNYSSPNHEFRGCSDSWIFERTSAQTDETHLIFWIERVDVQTSTSEDRTIVLELDEELVEDIDEALNDVEDEN